MTEAQTTAPSAPTALAKRLELELEKQESGSVAAIDLMNELSWELGLESPQRSRELADQALGLSREKGHERGIAFALRNVAYYHLVATELDDAIHHALDALERFRGLGEVSGISTTTGLLGMVYTRLGDYDKALDLSLQSLDYSRRADDRVGEAWASQNIGLIRYMVGEISEARANYQTALDTFRELSYPRGEIRLLNLLGTTYQKSGEYEKAIAYYEESLVLAQELQMTLGIAGNYSELGRCYQRIGERAKARVFFDDALRLTDQIPAIEFRSSGLLNLSELEIEEGNEERALELLTQALSLVKDTQAKRTIYRVHQALSEMREKRGETDAALAHFKEYHRLHNEVFSDEGQVRLKNMEIRLGVEHAEKEATLNRQKFEELAAIQAELIRSEKMALLGDFVAGLSHELNTPIGVIKSNAMLAGRALERMKGVLEGEPAESVKRSLVALDESHRGTEQAASRVAELVSTLKKFARLDEADKQEVSVSETLEDTLALFESRLESRIRLVKAIERIPEMPCYPGELNQAFMTLLVNAEQAIEAEGEIRVSTTMRGSQIGIDVIDSGRGMSPDQLERLFDIDFQSKERQVRMRVGLSSALAIMQKHGGDIAVESELKKGTRFHIRMPFSGEIRPS